MELYEDFEMGVAAILHSNFRAWHPKSPNLQWLARPLRTDRGLVCSDGDLWLPSPSLVPSLSTM